MIWPFKKKVEAPYMGHIPPRPVPPPACEQAHHATPSAAMLEAGEKAVHDTFRQYGTNCLHDGGVVQMVMNVWRAMEKHRSDSPSSGE